MGRMKFKKSNGFGVKFEVNDDGIFPWLDRRELKKQFKVIGAEIANTAKRYVGKRGTSRPGQFPGKSTGRLQRTIQWHAWKSGTGVTVDSYKTPKGKKTKGMKVFYPAFVLYGHRAPKADMFNGEPDKRQRGKRRVGKKVAKPRKNWIVAATRKYQHSHFERDMKNMLENAVKIR